MNKRTQLTITGLLAISLLCKGAVTDSATNQPPQKKIVVEVACFAGVAAAGTYVVYSVWRCCKAAGLAGTNTPPPPTPPPIGGKKQATSNSAGLIPPGGSGIGGPVTTTVTGWIIPCSTYLLTNNDQALESKQDISTNGWTDWAGHPYTWFFTTQTDPTKPHLQSSTNLTDWVDEFYTVNFWVSSYQSPDPSLTNMANMAMVLYDANGPVLTNFNAINTNTIVNAGVRCLKGAQYYRVASP